MAREIPVEYYGGEFDDPALIVRAIFESLQSLPLPELDVAPVIGTIHMFKVIVSDDTDESTLSLIKENLQKVNGLEIPVAKDVF